jgi:hypothetical protein
MNKRDETDRDPSDEIRTTVSGSGRGEKTVFQVCLVYLV